MFVRRSLISSRPSRLSRPSPVSLSWMGSGAAPLQPEHSNVCFWYLPPSLRGLPPGPDTNRRLHEVSPGAGRFSRNIPTSVTNINRVTPLHSTSLCLRRGERPDDTTTPSWVNKGPMPVSSKGTCIQHAYIHYN